MFFVVSRTLNIYSVVLPPVPSKCYIPEILVLLDKPFCLPAGRTPLIATHHNYNSTSRRGHPYILPTHVFIRNAEHMPLTIECSQEAVDSALEMLWTLWHPVFVLFLFTLIKCLIFSFNYVILFILMWWMCQGCGCLWLMWNGGAIIGLVFLFVL